jgi:hypothetical protein
VTTPTSVITDDNLKNAKKIDVKIMLMSTDMKHNMQM